MISTSLLIRSFCQKCVTNVTKHLYIFEGLQFLWLCDFASAFCCHLLKCRLLWFPLTRIDCKEKPSRLNLINSAPNLPEFVTIWPCPTAWCVYISCLIYPWMQLNAKRTQIERKKNVLGTPNGSPNSRTFGKWLQSCQGASNGDNRRKQKFFRL